MKKGKTIFGITESPAQADRIVQELIDAGLKNYDISFLSSDKGTTVARRETSFSSEEPKKGKKGKGQPSSSVKSSYSSFSFSSVSIPGVGSFKGTGSLFPALHQSGEESSKDQLTRALSTYGLGTEECKKFENELKSGHSLLCIHTDSPSQESKVKQILQKEGTKQISFSQEKVAHH